jgi:hypothetical protein
LQQDLHTASRHELAHVASHFFRIVTAIVKIKKGDLVMPPCNYSVAAKDGDKKLPGASVTMEAGGKQFVISHASMQKPEGKNKGFASPFSCVQEAEENCAFNMVAQVISFRFADVDIKVPCLVNKVAINVGDKLLRELGPIEHMSVPKASSKKQPSAPSSAPSAKRAKK